MAIQSNGRFSIYRCLVDAIVTGNWGDLDGGQFAGQRVLLHFET